MAVNGKNKGNTFERTIANLLSDRFKDYTGKDKSFTRSWDSGSYFGGKNSKRAETHDVDRQHYGDIICPRDFKFSVECKHYKTPPSLDSMLKGKVKQWDTWLSQARQDASLAGKEYLLIVKYNNTETFCCISPKICGIMQEQVKLKYVDTVILSLSDFLDHEDSYYFNN